MEGDYEEHPPMVEIFFYVGNLFFLGVMRSYSLPAVVRRTKS